MTVLNEEINKHNRQIARLRKKVADLQEACTHEGLVKEYKGNTGNYCRDDDRYWINFDCPVCGKKWTEDQ